MYAARYRTMNTLLICAMMQSPPSVAVPPADHCVVDRFCNSISVERPRGISLLGPLVSAEQLILQELVGCETFQCWLGLTAEQVTKLKAHPTPFFGSNHELSRNQSGDALYWEATDRVASHLRRHLSEVLIDVQRKRLASVYLELEGLAAIRRTEVANLIGVDSDEKINAVQLIHDKVGPVVMDAHRQLYFTGCATESQEHELVESLCAVSRDLDCRIAGLLDKPQRKQLSCALEKVAAIDEELDKLKRRLSIVSPDADVALSRPLQGTAESAKAEQRCP